MHSFDFEEHTLTFSVPKHIMNTKSFGNVPGGVEVDLAAITKDASLGIKVAQNSTSTQHAKGSICPFFKHGEKCFSEMTTLKCYDKPCVNSREN